MSEYNSDLNTPIQYIKGVGPKRVDALNKVSIYTVNDLLHYYPRRYLDRSTVKSIKDIQINDEVTIIGNVEVCGERRTRKGTLFQVVLSDGTGLTTLVWFNSVKYIKNSIKKGDRVAVHGKIEFYKGLQIVHPDYDKLDSDADPINTGSIIALYPLSAELKRAKLEHRSFRRIINSIDLFILSVTDHLDESIIKEERLISLPKALKSIHFPKSNGDLKASIQRLKFDEHLFLQLLMFLRKSYFKKIGTKSLTESGPQVNMIIDELGFELTGAQKRVIKEITNDMAKNNSMNRLLQGDVGSGKTIVAVIAAVTAVTNGVQVAIMAPTEILAHQHYKSFTKQLNKVHINCALLVGKQKIADRKKILSAIENGMINVVVGTLSLIQKDVKFNNLGFIVVD